MKHLNTLSSTVDELFREPGKRKSSGLWIWASAIILGSLFVYRSTRPVMRLRSDPPTSFYDHGRARSHLEREQAHRLANAYWQVAVRRVQPSFSPHRPLPAIPPPQFQIIEQKTKGDLGPAARREYYWNRLRKVWNQREAWRVSHGWSTGWIESAVNSIPRYTPQWFSDIIEDFIIFFNGIAQRISVP